MHRRVAGELVEGVLEEILETARPTTLVFNKSDQLAEEEIAAGLVDMLDGEPSGTDSLDWALERYGYKPTKGVTAEPEGTEEASPAEACEQCKGEREKYRQVVEINNANQRSYDAKTDALLERNKAGISQTTSRLQRLPLRCSQPT